AWPQVTPAQLPPTGDPRSYFRAFAKSTTKPHLDAARSQRRLVQAPTVAPPSGCPVLLLPSPTRCCVQAWAIGTGIPASPPAKDRSSRGAALSPGLLPIPPVAPLRTRGSSPASRSVAHHRHESPALHPGYAPLRSGAGSCPPASLPSRRYPHP